MARRRRQVEAFNLAFLDCICCGFGGIVLLLCMVKIYEPSNREQAGTTMEVAQLAPADDVETIEEKIQQLESELERALGQIDDVSQKNETLRGDLSKITGQFLASSKRSSIASDLEGDMAKALQKLTEEMKRLYGNAALLPPRDASVGGIPIDSEYIIFVIDTSGSMTGYAWDLAREKLAETLDVYPKVKGLQIMNDMGSYMFSQYEGKWIPDTPLRRKVILDRMATWAPFSNSSPVEGIREAIKAFYSPDRKISVYVFGDDFSGGSLLNVVRAVDRINQNAGPEDLRVRIHAVGFPVQFKVSGVGSGQGIRTGVRFAHLMRTLCERNGGTFIGLPFFTRTPARQLQLPF